MVVSVRVPVDIIQARGRNRLVAEKIEPAIQKRFFVDLGKTKFLPERNGSLPIVVPHDEDDTSIQGSEVFSNPFFVGESEVPEMVDRIFSGHGSIPIPNDRRVHLCRILERSTAVLVDIFVTEVRIRDKEVHPSPSLLVWSNYLAPSARLKRSPVLWQRP